MKTAMRAKDAARLSTIRMLLAAIKQREVDERIELADADVLAIIDKMIKQRRDSIAQFEAGKRDDLAAVERAEIARPRRLPAARSCPRPRSTRLIARRHRGVRRLGARRRWARSMARLKPKLAGRADMGAVSARIKAKLDGIVAWRQPPLRTAEVLPDSPFRLGQRRL